MFSEGPTLRQAAVSSVMLAAQTAQEEHTHKTVLLELLLAIGDAVGADLDKTAEEVRGEIHAVLHGAQKLMWSKPAELAEQPAETPTPKEGE